MDSKTKNIVWWIVRIIGIALLIGGVVLLVSGINMDVPNMGDIGWYEAETSRSSNMFSGITMISFGVMIIAVSLFANKAKSLITKFVNPTESNDKSIGDVMKGMTQEKIYHCEYCGNEVKKDQTKCQSCGASRKK